MMNNNEILYDVQGLSRYFPSKRGVVKAVDDVSFQIRKGETFSLVGESGCGKTTCGRTLLGVYSKTAGKVLYHGVDKDSLSKAQQKEYLQKNQMIFQDPYACLDPRMSIASIIEEGIKVHFSYSASERTAICAELLHKVGLPAEFLSRFPHELSGGQRQRVMIATALITNPKLLIADEPTTSLDVTIQAQILDLMKKIQQEEGMSILLITHDLGVVAEMCSRVIVMYAGEIVEEAPVDILFNHPSHPYTIGLIASVPKLGSGVKVLPSIPGSVPDLSMLPKGCRFAPRCKYATERCHNEEPSLFEVSPQQKCRCWLAEPTGKEDK